MIIELRPASRSRHSVRTLTMWFTIVVLVVATWLSWKCVRSLTMWLTVVVLAVFTLLLRKCLKGSKRKQPPGPWCMPIVGYLPLILEGRNRMKFKPNLTFVKLAKKYGDVFQLRVGSTKMVVVNGQRAVRKLYKKSTDFLGRSQSFLSNMKAAMLDAYLFTPFSLHYWVHKKLLFTAMKRFLAERSHEVEEAVHKIVRNVVDEVRKGNRKPFDPETLCNQISSTLTFYHTYGRLLNIKDEEVQTPVRLNSESLKREVAILECDMLPWMRFLPSKWKPINDCKTAFRLECEYIDKLTASSIAKYDGKTQRCFIDFLCHAAAQMDGEDKSIVEVDKDLIKKLARNVSFFGALLPLSIAIKWIIFLTALHSNVQEKVRDEINQKIGKDRQPSLRDADMLPYTTAAFKEIFRYTSMAALTPTKSTTCDTELDGYFIPKGTTVTVNLYSASRDGTVFPDPDTFDPQRFLNLDGTLNVHVDADVIEMGLGPRRCGGGELWWLELYTFFASMVQCCHIGQVPETTLDPDDYYFEVGLVPNSYQVVIY